MKAMVAGFAASVVITVGAWYGLTLADQFTSAERNSGDAVRLD